MIFHTRKDFRDKEHERRRKKRVEVADKPKISKVPVGMVSLNRFFTRVQYFKDIMDKAKNKETIDVVVDPDLKADVEGK